MLMVCPVWATMPATPVPHSSWILSAAAWWRHISSFIQYLLLRIFFLNFPDFLFNLICDEIVNNNNNLFSVCPDIVNFSDWLWFPSILFFVKLNIYFYCFLPYPWTLSNLKKKKIINTRILNNNKNWRTTRKCCIQRFCTLMVSPCRHLGPVYSY